MRVNSGRRNINWEVTAKICFLNTYYLKVVPSMYGFGKIRINKTQFLTFRNLYSITGCKKYVYVCVCICL